MYPPQSHREFASSIPPIKHEGEAGKFSFHIADVNAPIWYGNHSSGAKLAIYRAKVEGETKYPLLVYIHVLIFYSSEGVMIEYCSGYKIFSAFKTPEIMFRELMETVDSQLLMLASDKDEHILQ